MVMPMFVLRSLVLALLLAVAPAPAKLPPIPAFAPTVLGPIEVKIVPGLLCNDRPALGCSSPDDRYLAIRDSMPLTVQWQALYHELAHLMFYYNGIKFTSEAMEEKFCDAIANQRVMEMLGNWPERK